MSFVTALALAVALLVAAPIAAHMLRRRRADERPFSAVALVPPTPPVARRRSRLEDRGLFAVRAAAVAALALLGATPLVTCSRLTIGRENGASVALALVVDDSLSMRARLGEGGPTRFERALAGARELVSSARPGDAIAVVLAGAPPRVALASTTDTAAAGAALDALEPSDRATDLDGAARLASDLLRDLPQLDRRVVLLSDLADGAPDRPIELAGTISAWAPLPELEAAGDDCAVIRADRSGDRVRVRVACTAPRGGEAAPSSQERAVEVRAGERALGSAKIGALGGPEEVSIALEAGAPGDLRARLTGADAIPDDDEAPVLAAGGSLAIAVIADASSEHVETGGPPPIEQALTALSLDAEVRPLPAVPEHPDELAAHAALIVDDPPGFTPEARRSLAAWVDRGGTLLLALGPRAASAPLGAGFEPLVPGVVRWGASPTRGADPASAPLFGESAAGLADLAPSGRASVEPRAVEGADLLARWSDGAPLLFERRAGRGVVIALTLPLGTSASDLALRPAFLSLLRRLVDVAHARGGARRIQIGEAWAFDGYGDVRVERLPRDPGGQPEAVAVSTRAARGPSVSPSIAGLYRLTLDGAAVTRAASVPEREIDLRPRRVDAEARAASLGGPSSATDASPQVALVVLGLFAAELGLRALTRRR
jgi:hypothetical protein